MEIKKIEMIETTVEVNLYHYWAGKWWIFVAEVNDGKKKRVAIALLNECGQIELSKPRYCDNMDHAWFRLEVQHHGNCHNDGYRKNWNRAVKSHMLSNFHSYHNNDANLKFNKTFKGLDDMEIVFASNWEK